MAMELLCMPYLADERVGFYGAADARRFRHVHLERILTFWPYMAVVDAFQHWVYTHQEEGRDPANCDAAWLNCWERFMPGVDWSDLEQAAMTGWHRKQHIFRYPFYYVEYGLAQLGAIQIWRNSLDDPGKALDAYRTALRLGGTRALPELYQAAGANLAFDEEALDQAVQLIEEHLLTLE
jgi:oligoendopeptidase F